MHKDAVCNTFAARLSCQELLLKKKKINCFSLH